MTLGSLHPQNSLLAQELLMFCVLGCPEASTSPILLVGEDGPETQALGPQGNWTTFLHGRTHMEERIR